MPKSKHGKSHKARAAKRRSELLERKKVMKRQFEKFIKEQMLKNENTFITSNNYMPIVKPEELL